MQQRETDTPAPGRPYRSHKLPACSSCRQRKIRCHVDDPSDACRFCRERGFECNRQISKTKHSYKCQSRQLSTEQQTVDNAASRSMASGTSAISQNTHANALDDSSPLMMNPTMAEDVDVLERHLVSNAAAGMLETRPYIRISNTLNESIIYHTVPRQRKGLQATPSAGVPQREIMEQVLGPFLEDVIAMYFDKIHPCFPILDEASFRDLWKKDPKRISSTLMCDIYASALLYWNSSEKLSLHQRPDIQFAWNQAVMALRDDFMAPSMTTIHATLLDLLGRPIYQVTGNIINAGRSVALAHSLGLHRDPSTWRISVTEKNLRIRVWWGVVIHDYWSSLSHGTPPNIHRKNYNVPLPVLGTITGASGRAKSAASSFVYLCSLTRILGDILPLIYSLDPEYEDSWKSLRRIECALDEWEDQLPEYLHPGKARQEGNTRTPGSSGLWFCFLSTKLMLRRLAFKMTLHDQRESQVETKNYHFALLRKSALTVVKYISLLRDEQLHEFWLPYTAHLLVSASTTLLRCIVESSDAAKKEASSIELLDMMRRLQSARRDHDWDLADSCIDTCGRSIEAMARANSITTRPAVASTRPVAAHEHIPEEQNATTQQEVLDFPSTEDVSLPIDSLEIPWDWLWDDYDEPWRLFDPTVVNDQTLNFVTY